MKPTILLYNFTDRKRKTKISGFCAMNGIRVRVVEKEEYGHPLMSLLELQAEAVLEESQIRPSAQTPGELEEEMLVMCGLEAKTNSLLAYLRRERVIVPLKAMLTPVNQRWNSLELYGEIREEHRQLSQRQ